MRTKLIITIITIALIASALAAYQCTFCKGSGWQGSFKCFHCGGDGTIGD